MLRFSSLSQEVYAILSDEQTLRFIPCKRMRSLAQTESFLKQMLLSYHAGRNYLHFITERNTGKVVGMIDLITPDLAQEHYKINEYPFFVEFYLASFASGCYLMTETLPA